MKLFASSWDEESYVKFAGNTDGTEEEVVPLSAGTVESHVTAATTTETDNSLEGSASIWNEYSNSVVDEEASYSAISVAASMNSRDLQHRVLTVTSVALTPLSGI